MQELSTIADSLMQLPLVRAVLVLAGAIVLAILVRLVFARVILGLTRKTRSDLDDQIVAQLRQPVVWTIVLVGVALVVLGTSSPAQVSFVALGVIKTFAVLLWSRAALEVGSLVLEALSQRIDRVTWIQPKTLPLLEMSLKVAVVAGSLYFAFVAWNVDVTSWLASAGIIGIAVGFAARDTLANLFAGVFIIADAPYKIGDFVNLDSNLRGQVLDIGIRSTRILTRDDVEVTVPNAVIANAKIINETGGPHAKMRVRVKVSVAYGSDLDQVGQVLLSCVEGVPNLCATPEPRVRFRTFGGSGLDHELLAWIDEPVFRGRVLHDLNTRVYNALNAAGIEIPYDKLDVYVKETPQRSAAGGS